MSIYNSVFWILSPVILAATWLGIFLFSFARDRNIRWISTFTPGKANGRLGDVDALLRTAASVLAAVALLLNRWTTLSQ